MLACPSYDPPTTRHGSLAGSKNGSPQQDLSMPPHTVRKQGCEGTPERNKQRRQREQAGPLPGSSLPYCSFMKWPKSSLGNEPERHPSPGSFPKDLPCLLRL